MNDIDYSRERKSLALFWDSEHAEWNARRAATFGEAETVGTYRAEAASLAGCRLGALTFVELGEGPSEEQDLFLQLLDARVEDERGRLIVSCRPESIDLVFARTGAERTEILAGATDADRQLALAAGFALPRADAVAELTGEDGLRIQRLADEVGRIARSLAALTDGETAGREAVSDGLVGFRSPFLPTADAGGIDAEDIRAVIRLRRLRDRFFEAELFADPAWDMLLDLMAARLDRTKVSVSSLCIAAAVPPTTALRWIKTMTDRGLFKRVQDPHDARRVFIELSDGAAAGMQSFFLAAKATGGLIV